MILAFRSIKPVDSARQPGPRAGGHCATAADPGWQIERRRSRRPPGRLCVSDAPGRARRTRHPVASIARPAKSGSEARAHDRYRLCNPWAGTLATGDYSVLGLENIVAVERKSLADLLGCIGQHRERFDREVQRLLAYPTRAIVVEATWPDLEQGEWRSQITASAAIGSVLGWIAAAVPIILAGDYERAGRYVSRLLFTAARRRWREAGGASTCRGHGRR